MGEEGEAASLHQEDKATKAVTAFQAGLGERLLAVVLFGSRARGEALAGSDWDLLVIAKRLPAKLFRRHLFLKRLLPPECRGDVSLMARTPKEFEAHIPSIYLDIALDGRILYDPTGYASARLGGLNRQIKEVGLYRERVQAGDVWRWSKGKPGPWPLSWGS